MRSGRDGFGLIIGLALFLVLIAGAASFSLSHRGSQVLVEVRTGQDVTGARLSAQAALEELAFSITSRANDPASPYFDVFRQKLLDAVPIELPATVDQLTHHARNVATAYPRTRLIRVKATVTNRLFYRDSKKPWLADAYGTLVLSTRVQVLRGTTVASEIVADRSLEFKLLRTTPTPPFSQFPLTLVNPAGWFDAHARFDSTPAEDAETLIRSMVNDFKSAEQQTVDLKKAIPEVEKASKEAAAEIQTWISAVNVVLDANKELREWWTPGSAALENVRYFRLPQLRYLLSGDVDCEEVNLPQKLLTKALPRLAQHDQYEKGRQELKAKLDANDVQGSIAAFKNVRTQLTALLDADAKLLVELRTLQERFTRKVGSNMLEEPNKGVFGPYVSALRTGNDTEYTQTPGATRVAAGRVTHELSSPDARRNLMDLLDQYGPTLSAIIDVRNAGEELVITGADAPLARISGRVTLVVRGDLNVSNLKLTGAGGHPPGLLTIICHGRLRAQGRVDAALAALKQFEPTGPLTVAGPLYLHGSVFDGDIEPEKVLAGVKIKEDQRFHALDPANKALPSGYRVLFGPYPFGDTWARVAPGRAR